MSQSLEYASTMVSSIEANNVDVFPSVPNHDSVFETINLSISNVISIQTHCFGSIDEIDQNNGNLSQFQKQLKDIEKSICKHFPPGKQFKD